MIFSRSRLLVWSLVALAFVLSFVVLTSRTGTADYYRAKTKTTETPYVPPPVHDPFSKLSTGSPLPPIPKWNQARENLHKDYNLPIAPPLLIGFTRSWPLLIQAVVSYITAGWPASQIYVIENTGVQQANTRGQLTLQNPFYLNHTVLKDILGVNVVQTPTLLTFAQMQNFFLALSYEKDWPFYFWSHMDVLVFAYEDGAGDLTPPYNQPGYKSLYELSCMHSGDIWNSKDGKRYANLMLAYDHLAWVNREAYEELGGWDVLIPYYMTDCDMYSRVKMAGWTIEDRRAGAGPVNDIGSALSDLRALYRVPGASLDVVDPNPPAPTQANKVRRAPEGGEQEDENLRYFRAVRDLGGRMDQWKQHERGRNNWQQGQRGGEREPFYYSAAGHAQGVEMITNAGRAVYTKKWGESHQCDLLEEGEGRRNLQDQWKDASWP